MEADRVGTLSEYGKKIGTDGEEKKTIFGSRTGKFTVVDWIL
jgi:hypothetical protein